MPVPKRCVNRSSHSPNSTRSGIILLSRTFHSDATLRPRPLNSLARSRFRSSSSLYFFEALISCISVCVAQHASCACKREFVSRLGTVASPCALSLARATLPALAAHVLSRTQRRTHLRSFFLFAFEHLGLLLVRHGFSCSARLGHRNIGSCFGVCARVCPCAGQRVGMKGRV